MNDWLGPWSVPVGRFTLAAVIAFCTASMPMPRAVSASGFTWTRTEYFCEPKTWTWATPLTMEIRWAIEVSAYSSTVDNGSSREWIDRYRIGWSAGLTFWNDGGLGISGGRSDWARAMAVTTSTAAPSRFLDSANCRVICVTPSELVEVMESRPAMAENCRSSGVATEDAIVSGLAPGRAAVTWRVGKSTLGSSLTGRRR